MNEQIFIEGTVESIIYSNQTNGYTVFSVSNGEDEEVVCVGYLSAITEGESVKLFGSYVVHPVYGKQFSTTHVERIIPTKTVDICKYLSSGVIKGVREKLAQKIVDKFKEDTFAVIEQQPQRLAEIKGISLERALAISEVFKEQTEMRRVMLFLQQLGITPAFAIKIYKTYKNATFDIVKTNPYTLADDITGIGFKTADVIAMKAGISPTSPFRVEAGIKYALLEGTLNGHVYLPKSRLIDYAAQLLNVPVELVFDGIVELQMKRAINQEVLTNSKDCDGNTDSAVYLSYFYYAENYVSKRLLTLASNTVQKSKSIENDISAIERETGITLAENQREAVRQAVTSGVLIVTGGPGTGKTTTINTIITLLKKYGNDIELAAPTGRAAKRMSEATGNPAKTIHRLLQNKFSAEGGEQQSFFKDENDPLEADVIIIDESSMVDILLMSSLLKAVPDGARLILVGDVNQLPSIGAGNVLNDVIESGCINVIKLKEVFRQAQKSAIVMNAHCINKGEYPALNHKESDFFFVGRANVEDVLYTTIDLVKKRLPNFVGECQLQDIQVITPMRKSPLGTQSLNNMLQQALNEKSEQKNERQYGSVTFREGDKVMQTKNNYSMAWRVIDSRGLQVEEGVGVFNGDTGIIRSIDTDNETVVVAFDENRLVNYDFTQLEELELAFAITVHKSQGSEYRIVVIPIFGGPPMLMSRNLLYTAITRAKELVVIVGDKGTLFKMVDNDKEVYRYTSLCERIRKMKEFL